MFFGLFGSKKSEDDVAKVNAATAHAINIEEVLIEKGKLDEVKSLLSSGRAVEAVKLVREETQSGLKEAKDFVDSLR